MQNKRRVSSQGTIDQFKQLYSMSTVIEQSPIYINHVDNTMNNKYQNVNNT